MNSTLKDLSKKINADYKARRKIIYRNNLLQLQSVGLCIKQKKSQKREIDEIIARLQKRKEEIKKQSEKKDLRD